MPRASFVDVPKDAWDLPEELELRAQYSGLLQSSADLDPRSLWQKIYSRLKSIQRLKPGSIFNRSMVDGASTGKEDASVPTNEPKATATGKWIPPEDKAPVTRTKRFLRKLHGGWRTGVAWGALGALVLLIINVTLLIWIRSSHIISDSGLATIFEGDCEKKTNISLWCHLFINACSTLLLSASNNAMQCLSAPTRSNVDRAHARGSWLDIGIPSIRNLRIVEWKRVLLWAILGLSSLPLHLFYNSVVSTTLSTTDYKAVLATEDFLNHGSWDGNAFPGIQATNATYTNPDNVFIAHMQELGMTNNKTKTEDLAPVDCFRAYNNEFVSDKRNVIIIGNGNSSGPADSVLRLIDYTINTAATSSPDWLCGASSPCDRAARLYNISTGERRWSFNTEEGVFYRSESDDLFQVSRCRVERFVPHCKVTFSVYTLLIVVVCNALKALTLILVLFLPGFTPLITVGDAVSSFLSHSDPTTDGCGILGPATTRGSTGNHPYVSKSWKPTRCRRFCGASSRQWTVSILSTLGISFPAMILLLLYRSRPFADQNGRNPTLRELWNLGFGADHTSTLVPLTTSQISNAIISNLPQLALSAIYLSYNLILTSMMMVAEYNAFADSHKRLRVSNPKGYQRSAYYLQLPYRYAVPLIIASGLLHWSVSQSFFQVNLAIFSPTGTTEPARVVSACGWSPIALIITLFLVAVLVLVLCALGVRSYNPGMPVMRSNSRDISAACHMPVHTPNAALHPVRYGAVDVQGWDRWRGSFSNEKVVPMIRKSNGGFRLDYEGEEAEEWGEMPHRGRGKNRRNWSLSLKGLKWPKQDAQFKSDDYWM